MTTQIKSIANAAVGNQGNSKPAGATTGDTRSNSTASKPSVGSDRVSLTSSATQLNALEDKINSLPVVDINRVAETRHALATGAHQVNPDSTADSLLATERAFAQN